MVALSDRSYRAWNRRAFGRMGLFTNSEMARVGKQGRAAMEKSRVILVSFFRWNWTNRYTNASANMVGKLKTPNTAVKIAPAYGELVTHVLDASRAVGVVSNLLDADRRAAYLNDLRADQARLREVHAGRAARRMLTIEDARRRRPVLAGDKPAKPEFIGRRVLDPIPLAEILPFIDWTFFFHAWELKGRFPAILDDPEKGEVARDLYGAAIAMLDQLVAGGRLVARATYGFWPANAEGDDIVCFADETRTVEVARFPMLRQQRAKAEEAMAYFCLADFVAQREAEIPDWLGAFAVTAGIGADDIAHEFEAAGDDYSSIMVKTLADRLAEALAEMLHARVRGEWGFGDAETLTQAQIVAEEYRGIRPALGYPACPDHSPKTRLFDLLGATDIGMELTESMAMMPAASVSGLYFSHPESRYFAVGQIGADQLIDYAARMGVPLAESERWLSPNLGD